MRKGGVSVAKKEEAVETAAVMTPEEMEEAYLNEKVSLVIPVDPVNPKNISQTVQVNGKAWQIRRGERVLVPRYVYMAYRDSEVQNKCAVDMIARLAKDN